MQQTKKDKITDMVLTTMKCIVMNLESTFDSILDVADDAWHREALLECVVKTNAFPVAVVAVTMMTADQEWKTRVAWNASVQELSDHLSEKLQEMSIDIAKHTDDFSKNKIEDYWSVLVRGFEESMNRATDEWNIFSNILSGVDFADDPPWES